ncbi:hypothetical protein ABN034_32975 [Actinopolymorpha sp. B11F2]|uniref:hypothetical protein n=1 Tax=Actinopolymorpha sp. B11F2 TaxID=3160862 RepID=UPI0032E46E97
MIMYPYRRSDGERALVYSGAIRVFRLRRAATGNGQATNDHTSERRFVLESAHDEYPYGIHR